MKYRPEIDGLRSVAVLPVILFHAGFSLFSGGYVGVDVFFVISGYLITTILISERENGTYSLLGFYERRARRILPALFFVLICTIPFAWRLIPPDPFEDYARSMAFAAMFISNIHFIEHSGYFDTASQLRPLLHTWSLAVEEQYYLLFPLVLWALGGFARGKFIWVFTGLSVVSLGIAEWGLRNYPLENFFFTPSRLWELLGGSICAALLFGRKLRGNNFLALVGLALILFSVFWYDTSVRFPSRYTLVPVVGAMLIILYAAPGTWVAWLLSLRPMVGIGLISYSAYLWHQPLFVFARFGSVSEPSLPLIALMIFMSLALAYLTWRFIEAPFRNRTVLGRRNILLVSSAVGIAALAGFGLWGDATKGVPSRLDRYDSEYLNALRTQLREVRGQDACIDRTAPLETLCTVYQPENPVGKVAVLGDSHAQVLLPAFEALSQAYDLTVMRGVKAACPPLLGVYLTYAKNDAQECANTANLLAAEVVRQKVDAVFLVARWSIYSFGDYSGEDIGFMISEEPDNPFQSRADWEASFEAGLRNTVSFYRNAGIRVIVIPQVPQQQVFPENLLLQALMQDRDPESAAKAFRMSFVEQEEFAALTELQNRVLARMVDEYGAEILSLNSFFEEGDRYAWYRDGSVYFSDGDHLTLRGALGVAPLLVDGFKQD